jgi:ubiquinone/menaquinone biosynthesis C-methylase UbiE
MSNKNRVDLTISMVEKMSYTDFIALLGETNRCPGGKRTIRRIREVVHIDNQTKILDVGSNTGFTSLEFARITPAYIYGIDISEPCVAVAKNTLSEDSENIRSRVKFQLGSAYEIPFPDNEFDLVMVGGATSFMEEKSRAVSEYLRVLKPWGFLVSSPLIYHTNPPQHVVDAVSNEIGVKIEPMNKEKWIEIVNSTSQDFELYFEEQHSLTVKTDEEIEEYVDFFLRKEHIQVLSDDIKEAVRKRWLKTLKVFNVNHQYLGYDIIVFRKRLLFEEPELFLET